MSTLRKSLSLAALASLLFAGPACSSDDDASDGGGPRVTLNGTVLNALTRVALNDVEVCFDEPAGVDCVTSDDDGKIAARVPTNSRPKMKLNKDGFMPVLAVTQVGTEDVDGVVVAVLPKAAAQVLLGSVGVSLDDTKGQVLFSTPTDAAGNTRVEGVVVESNAPSDAFFYVDPDNNPDPALTATSPRGAGALVNVPPGTYELTFSHPSKTCTAGLMVPAANQPASGVTAELPIEAGYMTLVSAFCN